MDSQAWIRDRIARGELPDVDCPILWYGAGRGQRCAVCQTRILGSDVAIDCEPPATGETIWFHGRCYGVWHTALTAA
jgi:hypothetical protein